MKNDPNNLEQQRVSLPASQQPAAPILPIVQNEPDKDLLWKQYELYLGLYKHYLELVLKFNIFYYASTGAILSFYFSKTDVGLIKYSLLFPVMASIGFGFLFLYGAYALRVKRLRLFDRMRDNLDLDSAPEVNVLSMLLIVSALLMFGVVGVILWLFLNK